MPPATGGILAVLIGPRGRAGRGGNVPKSKSNGTDTEPIMFDIERLKANAAGVAGYLAENAKNL